MSQGSSDIGTQFMPQASITELELNLEYEVNVLLSTFTTLPTPKLLHR